MYTYYGSGRVVVPTGAGNTANEPNSSPTTPQRGLLMNQTSAETTCDVVWDDGRAESGVKLGPYQVLSVIVRSAANASVANAVYVIRQNNRR